MTRSDMYMKHLAGLAAWLRAQGDEAGAERTDELAEHLNVNHEGVGDQTTPTWAQGEDDELDVEPNIRCSPAPGIIFENTAGELVLTIDMLTGGDVAVVHMGDVVRWVENRGAPDPELARGRGVPETPAEAADRRAIEAAVGEDGAIDAEFETSDWQASGGGLGGGD